MQRAVLNLPCTPPELAGCPWTLTVLCLSFPICKKGVLIVPVSQVCYEIE